jgi:hypothetical protein
MKLTSIVVIAKRYDSSALERLIESWQLGRCLVKTGANVPPNINVCNVGEIFVQTVKVCIRVTVISPMPAYAKVRRKAYPETKAEAVVPSTRILPSSVDVTVNSSGIRNGESVCGRIENSNESTWSGNRRWTRASTPAVVPGGTVPRLDPGPARARRNQKAALR